jgi:hypothetical protein
MKEELIKIAADDFELEITELEATKALTSAINDFELKTGISPFLYKNEETKEYVVTVARDTSGANVLFLDNYVNSQSVVINGKTLAENTDYEILDRSMIAFFCYKLTLGLKVLVTGKWGYAQSYPEDVEHALKLRALCTVLETKRPTLLLANRIEINTLRIEVSGVNNNLRKQLMTPYDETVELYRFNQGFIG